MIAQRDVSAISAIATSTALAVVESASIFLQKPWPGVTPWWSYGNSLLTVFVLGLFAVLMAYRDHSPAFLRAAWFTGYVAGGYLVIHAITLRVSGSRPALIEALLGLLLIAFVRRAVTTPEPSRMHIPRGVTPRHA